MRIIISESQFNLLVEGEKNKKIILATIEELGLKNALTILGMSAKKLVDMGIINLTMADKLGLNFDEKITLFGNEISKLPDIGVGEVFDGYLDLRGTQIKSLGNLKSVDGSMDLRNTQIEDLGNLTWVANDLYLTNTPIKDLGNLKHVDGDLFLNYCDNLTDLGNLKSVGGYLYLRGTPISRTMPKYDIKKKIKVRGEILI